MNVKIRDGLFFLTVFTLVFNCIPGPIQFNFLGGPLGTQLCVYPLLAGFLYSFWCQYKYGNVFVDRKPFLKYISLYILVGLLSAIVGLITYPYYDLVLNGPLNQIEKLPRVLAFLHSHGIEADPKYLMQAWIVARQIKGVFFDAFWCFGGAYLIYCWYKEEPRHALALLLKGVFLSFLVLLIYGAIETAYLAGSNGAAEILKTINPYIHPIVQNHGWWPPLLWKGQMRLVFAEPSYVGNYTAFVLPLLWGGILLIQKKSFLYISLMSTMVIIFFIGLSRARTAYALLVGMLVLLFLLILIAKRWDALKKYILIVGCVAIGFGAYVGFSGVQYYARTGIQIESSKVAKKAIEDNLGSLASRNQRSNGARYALLKSNIRTGLQHPFLGVGRGLAGAFTVANFTEEDIGYGEVSLWVQLQKEYGFFASKTAIPDALNEYISRFSTTGILGLGIFLFPFLFILARLWKWMKKGSLEATVGVFVLGSIMAAGLNNNLTIFYGTWILLGILYVMIMNSKDKDFGA